MSEACEMQTNSSICVSTQRLDACKTSEPYIKEKNRVSKRIQSKSAEFTLPKNFLGPLKKWFERRGSVFLNDFHPQKQPLEAPVFSGGPRSW